MQISVSKVLAIAASVCVAGTAIAMFVGTTWHIRNEDASDEKAGAGGRSLDASAVASRDARSGEAGRLPEQPTREMVKSTLATYTTWVSDCARNQNEEELAGSMKLEFRIQPSGKTSEVAVRTEKFEGTDVGACMRTLVEDMEFPKTQKGTSVVFPFPIDPSDQL